MDTSQKFSLGTLLSGTTTSGPSDVDIKVVGRGIFCEITMEFSFSVDDPSVTRLFTVDRPWNATLSGVSLNKDSADRLADPTPPPLPYALKSSVEGALQEGRNDAVTCYFGPGQSLRSLTLTFVMACDILWHKSVLTFAALAGGSKVKVDFGWDLSGLPDAVLDCAGCTSDSRFATLDTSRRKWAENLNLSVGDELTVVLSLDQKKAASLCLYTAGEETGCGAVVVVAPVRPQLERKPVKIAVVVEIRNPQEGLVTRELVDKLSSTLNPKDEIAIWFMGSSVTRQVMNWTEAGQVTEENLAKVLDPALMGRTQYFWESYQRVLTECQDASHILLSSPGPKVAPPEGINVRQPVFALATGRRPNRSTLGDLAALAGGCLSEISIDGIESFLNRVKIRLSPPLLRDFRLEGWGLENLSPSGLTQVYTDRPTVVMGNYQGLLPQTVTLCGLSPAGQKLAQRVRVEQFAHFPLMPLLVHKNEQKLLSDNPVSAIWGGSDFRIMEFTRPAEVSSLFNLAEPEVSSSELDAPPAIDIVSTAVTLDDGLLTGPSHESIGDDPFEGSSDPGQTIDDDMFSGSSGATIDDDFFGGGHSKSVDDFFADNSTEDGPTFLDEEPVTRKSSVMADGKDGLPRISIGGSDGDASVDSSEAEAVVEEPIIEPPSTPMLAPTPTEPEEEEAPPPLAPDSTDLMLQKQPEPHESLDWGGFPSMDKSAAEMGAIPRGEELEQYRAPSTEESVEKSGEASIENSGEASVEKSGEASVEPSPAEVPPTHKSWAEKATVTVRNPFPSWAGQLVNLDGDALSKWLSNCPIDPLALALVGTDENLVQSLLGKLDQQRKQAVEVQMEWGKLLPAEERESAGQRLEELLATRSGLV